MMASTPISVAAADIGRALGVSVRTVQLRAARECWVFEAAGVRGGKQRRYVVDRLPVDVRARIAQEAEQKRAAAEAAALAANASLQARIDSQWQAWKRASGWQKQGASLRHDALLALEKARAGGCAGTAEAMRQVATEARAGNVRGRSVAALKRLTQCVAGIPREHWLPFLIPDQKQGRPLATIHPDAFAAFKRDFLRLEQPDAASCFRRVRRLAKSHPEWGRLPAVRTFMRHLDEDVPHSVQVQLRSGAEALELLGPKIRRHRDDLHAMDIVTSDGHRFDVNVQFPDGRLGRPVIVGWQDVYSNKLLAYRIGWSETAEMVRLSALDMVVKFGVPKRAHLDNGRAYTAKSNTGGMKNRYRFKVRDTDPLGALMRLGVDTHWVTPYNGKAKPIERAWRDLATDVAKRPEFAGAYTGNSPATKPANYGSRAVPWDEFLKVVADGVAEFNARTGRRSETASGRSFDEVFNESYAKTIVKRAAASQIRFLFLDSDVRPVDRRDGSVTLAHNRYWSEALCQYAGRRVEIRFDPDALHEGIEVFDLAGKHLCRAPCVGASGWNTKDGARAGVRTKREFLKAQRALAKAERARNASGPTDFPNLPDPGRPRPAAVALLHPRRPPALAQANDVDKAAKAARDAEERKFAALYEKTIRAQTVL